MDIGLRHFMGGSVGTVGRVAGMNGTVDAASGMTLGVKCSIGSGKKGWGLIERHDGERYNAKGDRTDGIKYEL